MSAGKPLENYLIPPPDYRDDLCD